MKKTWLDTVGRAIIEGIQTDVATLRTEVATLQADMAELRLEMEHDSDLFPESTARVGPLTAGAPADTWSDWAEVTDDTPVTPVTFSSKVTKETHITGMLVEDLSHKDKRYALEIAWGDAKTRV
ncbi:unnamed protein product, partial [marine sediment metagenome]